MSQRLYEQDAAVTLSSYSCNAERTCSQKRLKVPKITLNFINIGDFCNSEVADEGGQ